MGFQVSGWGLDLISFLKYVILSALLESFGVMALQEKP